MKLNRIVIIDFVVVGAMFVLSIWAWLQLPSGTQIATHFDLQGMPSSYMGKMGGLLLLPAIALIFVLALPLVPQIEPHRDNINRSSKAYTAFSLALVIFLSIVHGTIVLTALGWAIDIPKTIIITLGIFLIVLGNYLSKIRRNYSFGVRTPWTLASDLAWHKTHRLASWLTVIHGVGLLIAGWRAPSPIPLVILASFVITSLVILPVCSYFWWKSA